jgi:hypothetical protein
MQSTEEKYLSIGQLQKPSWINMKEYWDKRKQISQQLQVTHPLYRYPKSPYSNITKVVLNARSTSRLNDLSKPRRNFSALNGSFTCANGNERKSL